MEAELDRQGHVGSCHRSTPQLPGMPDGACKLMHCLWSDIWKVNVDLWLHAFTTIPHTVLSNRCPHASGGQVAPDVGTVPEVAVVLLVHTGTTSLQAAQALLELFRASSEVPSAEYIVVDMRHGSRTADTDEANMLQQVVQAMDNMFAVSASYVRSTSCFAGVEQQLKG